MLIKGKKEQPNNRYVLIGVEVLSRFGRLWSRCCHDVVTML